MSSGMSWTSGRDDSRERGEEEEEEEVEEWRDEQGE